MSEGSRVILARDIRVLWKGPREEKKEIRRNGRDDVWRSKW